MTDESTNPTANCDIEGQGQDLLRMLTTTGNPLTTEITQLGNGHTAGSLMHAPPPGTSAWLAVGPFPPTAEPSTKGMQHDEQAMTRCTEGCPETFSRPVDFHRHMKKHKAHTLKCIKLGCDKTFYRLDKLRDYIKRGHKMKF